MADPPDRSPDPPRRSLLAELKRRHVFRVLTAYAAFAFVVLQVADLVVEPLGLPGWMLRALVVATLVGLPVVLALAWIFDITPLGVRRTHEASAPSAPDGERTEPTTAPLSRSAAVVGVVALVAVAAGAYIAVSPDPLAPGDPIESVAVLPFDDMSPAGDQAYFAAGMTEELLDALANVAGLRVASRTSAEQFEGRAIDVREVGRVLGVHAVLEGSVRRDGDELRVTVQLIDVQTGYHLWSDSFDRRLTDVFEVQEQVSREIVRALRLEHGDEPLVRPGTADHAAYDHYLRGNYHLARRTPRDVRRALEEYEQALAIDPRFAAAMLRQAYAYAVWLDWGWSDPPAPRDDLLRRGDELVERALAEDADDPQAWLVRSYLRVVADPYHMRGATELFERAVALAPGDAEAWHQYGQTLMAVGRFEEAHAAYLRALDSEPLRAMTLVPLAAMDFYQRRFDRSIRWADSAVAADPANSYARVHRATERVMLAKLSAGGLSPGRGARPEGAPAGSVDSVASALLGEATRDVQLALDATQGHAVPVLSVAARVWAAAGDTAAALDFADRAERLADNDISATEGFFLAAAWTATGRPERAVAVLQRTRPQGAWLWFYLQSPEVDALRADPAYVALVRAADPRPAEGPDHWPFVAGPEM